MDHASQAALILQPGGARPVAHPHPRRQTRLRPLQTAQNERRASLSHHFSELQRLSYRPDSQALLAQVQARRQTLLAALGQITPLLDADDYAGARALYAQSGEAALSAYLQAVDSYLALQNACWPNSGAAASQTVAQFELWLQLIGGVGLLLAIAVGVWLVRRQAPAGRRPRRGQRSPVAHRPGRPGQPDPSGRAHPHSLLARLGGMRHGLRQLVGNIQGASGEVSSAARDLSASCAKLPLARWSKGASTASMASAVEELGSNITSLAQSSRRVLDVAARAENLASESDRMLGEAAGEIGKMIDTIDNSAQDVAQLASKTSEIGRIVGVINDIADQTNLLALNASIEAARAGEQGRALPWWPTKCANWPNTPPAPPPKSTDDQEHSKANPAGGGQSAARRRSGRLWRAPGARPGQPAAPTARRAGETRRELDGLMLALDEQTHAARHIGSHIERVASAAEEFGLAARSSAKNRQRFTGRGASAGWGGGAF